MIVNIIAFISVLAALIYACYLAVKNCCKLRSFNLFERFATVDEPDSNLVGSAESLQQTYLPKDLTGMTGSYLTIAGIQSAYTDPKDDPWLREESYLM